MASKVLVDQRCSQSLVQLQQLEKSFCQNDSSSKSSSSVSTASCLYQQCLLYASCVLSCCLARLQRSSSTVVFIGSDGVLKTRSRTNVAIAQPSPSASKPVELYYTCFLAAEDPPKVFFYFATKSAPEQLEEGMQSHRCIASQNALFLGHQVLVFPTLSQDMERKPETIDRPTSEL